MNRKDLYNSFKDVDDDILERSELASHLKKRPAWVKWGSMVACLCLVIIGATLINHNTPVVVNQFEASSDEKYPLPEPGEYYCNVDVNAARKHYAGENAKYLLSFSMFKADGQFLSDEEKKSEYQRLIGLGYELYEVENWTYQGKGEKIYYSVVVGLFSEEDLADFNVNPNYGYAFHFESNGDGSAVSAGKSDLITEFNIGLKRYG